jgi:hypothetical protein
VVCFSEDAFQTCRDSPGRPRCPGAAPASLRLVRDHTRATTEFRRASACNHPSKGRFGSERTSKHRGWVHRDVSKFRICHSSRHKDEEHRNGSHCEFDSREDIFVVCRGDLCSFHSPFLLIISAFIDTSNHHAVADIDVINVSHANDEQTQRSSLHHDPPQLHHAGCLVP